MAYVPVLEDGRNLLSKVIVQIITNQGKESSGIYKISYPHPYWHENCVLKLHLNLINFMRYYIVLYLV